MAPVGVCGSILYTAVCWMYGWLRVTEINLPSESYFLNALRAILTDDLCVRRT